MKNIDVENTSKEELKQSMKWYIFSCEDKNDWDKDKLDACFIKAIVTYEDACEVLKRPPINTGKMRRLGYSDQEIAIRKLSTIVLALNGGKKVKPRNETSGHWEPRFRFDSERLPMVFSHSICITDNFSVSNGSLLALNSKALSDYCGKKFLKLWRVAIL